MDNTNRAQQTLQVKAHSAPLECDRHMVWTKLAYDIGIISDASGELPHPECTTLEELVDVNWNVLTIADFC